MSLVGDPASIAKRIHVPSYDEILERIGRRGRQRRGRRRPAYEEELEFLQRVRDVVISRTDFVRDVVRLLDSLHPFYWDLIEIEFDRSEIRNAISCISRSRKMTDRLFEKYRVLLMASESPREARSVGREARGRILSMYKRCSRGLDLLRSLLVFMHRLPAVEAGIPTIVVSGPPSSGKSTFVGSVSRAQPRVASYPFTTRQIHIGHHILEDGSRIQVVDTPGVLDRHFDEMNDVERRAAAALRRLDGAILFLYDPTRDAYMPLERQSRLLTGTVARLVGGRRVYVAVNKRDAVSGRELEEALREAENAAAKIRGVFLGGISAAIKMEAEGVVRRIASSEGWLEAGSRL